MSTALRYLSGADVRRCLPPIGGQIDLAEEALMALARDAAEVPPMGTVHPRDGSLLDAMPAWDKTTDTVGLKWVAHYPRNPSRDLPVVSGLIVINDPDTGMPLCVMDGAEITGRRTAAISGAAVRLFAAGSGTGAAPSGAHPQGPPTVPRIGFIGAGTQARMHLELLTETLGRLRIAVYDAADGRAEAFAAQAAELEAVLESTVVDGVESVCEGVDILVSAASTRLPERRVVRPGMLAQRCMVLAVDWAAMLAPEVAEDAGLFLVDDLAEYTRACDPNGGEWFAGFPRPHGSLGRALLGEERLAAARDASSISSQFSEGAAGPWPGAGSARARGDAVVAALGGRPDGRILVGVLGMAVVDVVLAGAVYRVAAESGVGQVLPH